MNNLDNDSFWGFIKPQWKIFCQIIFQPWFVLALLFATISLLLSYLTTDKSLSIFLNILSCFLTSIAGALFYDSYMQISGNTILVKKGKGAVRNLFLVMERIRNISSRSKESASPEEIRNLLWFIEKDVYNSIQEWTDVIPNIADVDGYTNIMNEKEAEINDIKTLLELKNEQLSKQANETNGLKIEKDKLEKEKENLLIQLQTSKSELNQIKHARDKAITASSTVASLMGTSGTSGTIGVSLDSPFMVGLPKLDASILSGVRRDSVTGQFVMPIKTFDPTILKTGFNMKLCSRCGKEYEPNALNAVLDLGKCGECMSKPI